MKQSTSADQYGEQHNMDYIQTNLLLHIFNIKGVQYLCGNTFLQNCIRKIEIVVFILKPHIM